ncbi:MAG: hypothetical protein IPK35_20305 [Saprospiraceae bacterium]|nr:hypothetical protein [Saprospiraceae bacterium]
MEVKTNTKKKQFLIILDIFIACISEEDAKLCFFGGNFMLNLFLKNIDKLCESISFTLSNYTDFPIDWKTVGLTQQL